MDLHQQIPQYLNELETRFVTLSSAFTTYGITVADLFLSQLNNTLIDIAKRTGRSLVEINEYVSLLSQYINDQIKSNGEKVNDTKSLIIPTGISQLDSQLPGGGLPRGQITEIFGASGCGKLQMLLQLTIEAQLGSSAKSIYISTEAPLETRRLEQMISLRSNDCVSMNNIDCIYCDDLESQDHILFTQLPTQLSLQPQGTYNLVIIDSIGHHSRGGEDFSVTNENYLTAAIQLQQQQQQEVENDSVSAVFTKLRSMQQQQLQKFFKSTSEYDVRISRKKYLMNLQRQLIELAQKYNVAIVMANQVTDQPDNGGSGGNNQYYGNDDPLNFNFQLGQISGWDLSTIYKFQQTFCNNQLDDLPMTYPELIKSLSGTNKRTKLAGNSQDNDPRYQRQHLQHRASEEYDVQQQHINHLHQVYNRETKRIIAALGYVWTKNIGCKILLVKNYRPLLKSKQSVMNSVLMADPELGITHDELYRGFDAGNNKSSLQDQSPEDLIDGWQVERYAKVVLNVSSTINYHNAPMQGKVSIKLDEAGFS